MAIEESGCTSECTRAYVYLSTLLTQRDSLSRSRETLIANEQSPGKCVRGMEARDSWRQNSRRSLLVRLETDAHTRDMIKCKCNSIPLEENTRGGKTPWLKSARHKCGKHARRDFHHKFSWGLRKSEILHAILFLITTTIIIIEYYH